MRACLTGFLLAHLAAVQTQKQHHVGLILNSSYCLMTIFFTDILAFFCLCMKMTLINVNGIRERFLKISIYCATCYIFYHIKL